MTDIITSTRNTARAVLEVALASIPEGKRLSTARRLANGARELGDDDLAVLALRLGVVLMADDWDRDRRLDDLIEWLARCATRTRLGEALGGHGPLFDAASIAVGWLRLGEDAVLEAAMLSPQ